MSVTFSNKLINWYNHNKRDLPWRKTKDPYKIGSLKLYYSKQELNLELNIITSF